MGNNRCTDTLLKSIYIIGLAGESCSGKNAVADILQQRGFFVVDADAAAKSVLHRCAAEVIRRNHDAAVQHGITLQTDTGTLNTRALGQLLFADAGLLAAHEAYILPKIEQEIQQMIDSSVAENPVRPIVLNAPTLHKTRFLHCCRFILYIEAPYLIRFFRCKKRDTLSCKEIFFRFLRQKNFFSQYLLRNADDMIRVKNRGSVKRLERIISRILKEKGL
ncbi:MAG: dephospho-CoA kinase [Treponema sp.]